MTIVDMLGQSGILTLLGMGVVFSFLIIMVLCMCLLRVILHALKLDKNEVVEQKSTSVASSASTDTNAVVAAIATAVREKTLNS